MQVDYVWLCDGCGEGEDLIAIDGMATRERCETCGTVTVLRRYAEFTDEFVDTLSLDDVADVF